MLCCLGGVSGIMCESVESVGEREGRGERSCVSCWLVLVGE